jgi:hypothetical protein
MTPESFAALGARLLLVQRFHLPQHVAAAMPDENAITLATAALTVADQVAGHVAGGAR